MTDSTSTAQPGATWVPIPLPPDFVDFVLKNQEKIAALASIFACQEGKATVHIKGGVIQGVQLEEWAYRRGAQATLSTPPHIPPRHVPT